MAQAESGSLLKRFSKRGANTVKGPQARCTTIERAVRPRLAGTWNGRLACADLMRPSSSKYRCPLSSGSMRRFSNARTRTWGGNARQASAEREHTSTAISDMHDGGLGREAAQTRDQAHPHVGLSFGSLSALAARFCHRSGNAHEGLLHRTAQHLSVLGQDGQDCLQIQPSPALVAAPLPRPWFWDDGKGLPPWYPEPAARAVSSQAKGLLRRVSES